jgi:taurine dioxygenase
MAYMYERGIHFELLPNDIGVRIFNLDLNDRLKGSEIAQISKLLCEHKVVIIEGQNLCDQNLEEFAFKFGSPFRPDSENPVLGSQDEASHIVIVGNNSPEFKNTYLGHQEVMPHSDHQWLRMPSSLSMLYAIEIEEESASTQWTNMALAYHTLDNDLKRRIQDVKIVTYNPFHRPFGSVSAKYVNAEIDLPPGNTFPHPLVRTHPLTAESILYFNVAYEVEFIGLPYHEGLELFEILKSHVLGSNSIYTHNWKKGDLVIWDNRATIHYRPSFGSSVRRILKRITISGEIPF